MLPTPKLLSYSWNLGMLPLQQEDKWSFAGVIKSRILRWENVLD